MMENNKFGVDIKIYEYVDNNAILIFHRFEVNDLKEIQQLLAGFANSAENYIQNLKGEKI